MAWNEILLVVLVVFVVNLLLQRFFLRMSRRWKLPLFSDWGPEDKR